MSHSRWYSLRESDRRTTTLWEEEEGLCWLAQDLRSANSTNWVRHTKQYRLTMNLIITPLRIPWRRNPQKDFCSFLEPISTSTNHSVSASSDWFEGTESWIRIIVHYTFPIKCCNQQCSFDVGFVASLILDAAVGGIAFERTKENDSQYMLDLPRVRAATHQAFILFRVRVNMLNLQTMWRFGSRIRSKSVVLLQRTQKRLPLPFMWASLHYKLALNERERGAFHVLQAQNWNSTTIITCSEQTTPTRTNDRLDYWFRLCITVARMAPSMTMTSVVASNASCEQTRGSFIYDLSRREVNHSEKLCDRDSL